MPTLDFIDWLLVAVLILAPYLVWRAWRMPFYGWRIVVGALTTFGIEIAFFYYGFKFFNDYFRDHLRVADYWILLGYPLAAAATLWVGPVFVPRIKPRMLILIGTGLICVCYIAFGTVTSDLWIFYVIWFFFVVGYIFSGPIPHQVLISQWFRKKRGTAMGVTYVGVGLFGAMVIPYVARPLTNGLGFPTVLLYMGPLVLLTWPIVFGILKDRPADVGQYPDGDKDSAGITQIEAEPLKVMLRKPAFWLLVVGSFASIGAIGSIFDIMKFVLQDQGFVDQAARDAAHARLNQVILLASIAGRIGMGWLADRFTKKYVMMATYFVVALAIPLLLQVSPDSEATLYIFGVVFGFAMGADYMLIPLMAAEQFGVNSLAKAMSVILPTDTLGQTWFPFLVALIAVKSGVEGNPDYGTALWVVFGLAMLGAIAVSLLPKRGKESEVIERTAPAK